MKMKALLILFMLAAITIHAQKAEITISENSLNLPLSPYPESKVFDASEDDFFVLFKKKQPSKFSADLSLEKINIDSKILSSVTFENSSGHTYYPLSFTPTKNGFIYFYSFHDAVKKTNSVFVREIGKEGKASKEREIVTIEGVKQFDAGNFVVAASPDGGKYAVVYEYPDKKGENSVLWVEVLDAAAQSLAKNTYTFDMVKGKSWMSEYYINNNGEFFILNRNKAKKGEEEYSIYAFGAALEMVAKNVMPFDEKQNLLKWKALVTSEGKLAFLGFHSEDGNFVLGGYKYYGIKLFIADAAGAITENNAQFEKSMPQFDISDVIEGPGNFYITGKRENTNQRSVSKPGSTMPETITDYRLTHIIAISLDKTGNLVWVHTQDKIESTASGDLRERLSLFTTLDEDGRLVILYNDALYKTTPGASKSYNTPYILHIDEFGHAAAMKVTGHDDYMNSLVPAGTLKVDNGNYVVILNHGSTYHFGIVDIIW